MIEFKMPSLGSDMDEGTLNEWLVKPGDKVTRGQVVAIVETTKAAVEVECWQEGIVDELVVPVGETVQVGTTLATLTAPGEQAEEKPRPRPAAKAAAKPAAPKPVAQPGTKPTAADRAQQMRKSIAAAMSRSKREIPHYYLAEEIMLEKSLSWLTTRNAQRSIDERVLPAVLLLKAVGVAAQRFGEFNGFWREDGFEPANGVHVGVGISLRGGGLVAPAIHDVPEKKLDELMDDLTDLVARARSFSLRSSEMSDPTITVTNLGDQGVDAVFGVIYPPQVAIVGFGQPAERVCVIDGGIRVVTTVQATLAADHRASDGHRGALFLAAINELLQQPDLLEK
ncbi:branched-chain alpha-keto acid dehydrogenase subunit E2 [Mycobacterium malmoense]|uniref:dihydrolipoamide acetyltransferase family protein n=1 Tax=Mycobacterium malmoense TaxID=1780 RepID=UPI00080BCDA5|nr:dihydrolipoamide acetyltransferase family protein [Mycobacterium malmoense]OCB22657.1 branched-chain alpha-keto acid dehydrogenase subunit E2 [Mycobacterium malmoense]